jgi:hypothetical protein
VIGNCLLIKLMIIIRINWIFETHGHFFYQPKRAKIYFSISKINNYLLDYLYSKLTQTSDIN